MQFASGTGILRCAQDDLALLFLCLLSLVSVSLWWVLIPNEKASFAAGLFLPGEQKNAYARFGAIESFTALAR